MESVKAGSEWLDSETMRVIVNSVTTAGICWSIGGLPQQAAALAAISTFGVSFATRALQDTPLPTPKINNKRECENLSEIFQWTHKNNRARLILGLPLAALVALGGKVSGLHAGWKGTSAAFAGVWGGTFLWSFSNTQYFSRSGPARLPALAKVIIAWSVGMIWPQWWTPSQGAVVVGLIESHRIANSHADVHAHSYRLGYATVPFWTAALFAIPWAATKLGVAADLKSFAYLMVATSVAESLFMVPQDLANLGAQK